MGTIQVRRMRADDVLACARIVAGERLWQRYGQTLPRARSALKRALASTGQAPKGRGGAAAPDVGVLAVACEAGRVVGFIWFHRTGTFHHSGYVRWIGVAPEARGKGVGRALMRYAEERIFKAGPNVFLLVADFNVAAQTFYEDLGYTRVGAIPDYVVRGVTELLYRRTRGPIAAKGRKAVRTEG